MRGVRFRSLTEALDTSTSGGRLVFSVFGAIAQFERELITERTRAGLAAAKAQGRVGGRPRTMTDANVAFALDQRTKGASWNDIAASRGSGRNGTKIGVSPLCTPVTGGDVPRLSDKASRLRAALRAALGVRTERDQPSQARLPPDTGPILPTPLVPTRTRAHTRP